MEISSLRDDWVGRQFEKAEFLVQQQDLLDWADACGETDPRFTDPANAEFQAHPGFTSHLVSGRALPEGFPSLGDGRGIDGGKSVRSIAPIHVGDTLSATAEIADIYDKTGRSGTMVFIVHRMSFENQQGEPVSVVDWRMIRNVAG